MADCGATGSALDRVISTVVGGTSSNETTSRQLKAAGMHLSSLLGNAAYSSQASRPVDVVRQDLAPIHSNALKSQSLVPPAMVAQEIANKDGALAHSIQQSKYAVEGEDVSILANQVGRVALHTTPHSNAYVNEHKMSAVAAPVLEVQRPEYHYQSYNVPMMAPLVQRHQQQMFEMQRMQFQQQEMQRMSAQMQQIITLQNHQQQQEHLKADVSQSSVNVAFDSEGTKVSGSIHTEENEGKSESLDASFDNFLEGEENYDVWSGGASFAEMAQAWAEAEAELSDSYNPDATYEERSMPIYELSQESRILAHPATRNGDESSTQIPTSQVDYLAEGYKHFQAGNLPRAITYFEAELQLRSDNVEAWTVLGKCHAENENDRNAIACLEHAVEHDPYALEALLPLGVSYVNELDTGRALRTLQAYIEHNPNFAGLEVNEATDEAGGSDMNSPVFPGTHTGMLHQVKELLHRALHHSLAEDPVSSSSVHEALGVCYNVSQEYDVAAEHMRKALDGRPNDYTLWNKLGATLANGNRSDEALPAYMRALEMKPKYARAWLNMAIAHSNLKQYHEAARCYLQTLSLNPEATHCWGYLRIALTCIERWDLVPLAAAQDLNEFHKHFHFIEKEEMG